MQSIVLQSLEILTILKNYHSILCLTSWESFIKNLLTLNNPVPQTENNKKIKQEVLTNAGDIYNELYYIYKNIYNKKINSLNAKNRIKLDYKKLRLSDDYQYSSEEEEKKQEEKTISDSNAFNEQINKEETCINTELFKNILIFKDPVIFLIL